MAHVSAQNPPHLWLVTVHGFLCALCLRWWQQAGDPYALCTFARQSAKDAIAQAEAASGLSIASLYEVHAAEAVP